MWSSPCYELGFLSILGLCKFVGDYIVQIGSLIFPHVVGRGCCGIPHILGTVVNSLESHFGHDRAKNDSEFVFPCSSCDS